MPRLWGVAIFGGGGEKFGGGAGDWGGLRAYHGCWGGHGVGGWGGCGFVDGGRYCAVGGYDEGGVAPPGDLGCESRGGCIYILYVCMYVCIIIWG